jgi:hypothetical protein
MYQDFHLPYTSTAEQISLFHETLKKQTLRAMLWDLFT